MSNFIKGYTTRYAGGSSTPLTKTGFACLCLAKFISREFGPGCCYYYSNDLYSTSTLKDNQEIYDYFFKDIYLVKRSNKLDFYREQAVNVIKGGWAAPSKNTDDFAPDPLAALTKEEMVDVVNQTKEIAIKLKKSTQSTVWIDELIRGPIQHNITCTESQFSLLGTNGMPLPLLCNVADDSYFNINIVIREWTEKHRTAQEMYLHYMRGTCPPYYIHVDFSGEFKIEVVDYIKNKLPPANLVDAVAESMIDRKNGVSYSDFRFVKPKVDKFSEKDVRKSLLIDLKNADKETRDSIIKAACPLACDQHINAASDISRMMAASDMSYESILNVCKSICSSNVIHKVEHAPNEASPEFNNLEAMSMRILSHDFVSSSITLETMVMNFCEKAKIHVEKIDSALEFCVIGSVHKNKDRRFWWYEVARTLGKEVIVSRIKNAIRFIKKSDKCNWD